MKSLKSYLSESTVFGSFVIKTVGKPTTEQHDAISRVLNKFGCQNLKKATKLENPALDFIDIPDREVWVIKFELDEPVSTYVLHQELKAVTGINDKLITVRNIEEPIEIYAEVAQEKSNEVVKKARLSVNRVYDEDETSEIEPVYGDEHNKNFLGYLSTVASERKSMEIEPADPLFSWLDMSKVKEHELNAKLDTTDFNHYIDTPKPVYKAAKKVKLPPNSKFLDTSGGFNNSVIQYPAFNPESRRRKAKS